MIRKLFIYHLKNRQNGVNKIYMPSNNNNIMYTFICSIRQKYPWMINFLNFAVIYPYRRIMAEYYYNKTPNQIYSFFYEGKRVSLFLPFRKDLIEQTIIVKKTFFEASELNIVREFIPENTVYVDIGANIGNHLIFFGLFTSSKKIYGFEPNSEIFPILMENVKLNNLEQKTILKQVAIGSEKSKGELVGSCDKTHIAYTDKGVCVCETGNIDILPLDLVVEEKIGFMKIDVEGMELDVIKGSMNRISSDKPIIFIESDKIEKVIELLNPKNYYIEKSLANYNYLLLPK